MEETMGCSNSVKPPSSCHCYCSSKLGHFLYFLRFEALNPKLLNCSFLPPSVESVCGKFCCFNVCAHRVTVKYSGLRLYTDSFLRVIHSHVFCLFFMLSFASISLFCWYFKILTSKYVLAGSFVMKII